GRRGGEGSAEEGGARAERLVGRLARERGERRRDLPSLGGGLSERADAALEPAEPRARRERPGADGRVLRLRALALAAAPVELAEEPVRLAAPLGVRIRGEVALQ